MGEWVQRGLCAEAFFIENPGGATVTFFRMSGPARRPDACRVGDPTAAALSFDRRILGGGNTEIIPHRSIVNKMEKERRKERKRRNNDGVSSRRQLLRLRARLSQ